MGLHQGKQPPRGEEPARPLLMGHSSTPSAFAESPSEDAPQSHADPPIDGDKRGHAAVFEIFKPAAQGSIEVVDDDREAVPVGASGFLTHRVFELLQTFLARQTKVALEVIAEKVKSTGLL